MKLFVSLCSLSLLVACDSPGSGGKGGFPPDVTRTDTSIDTGSPNEDGSVTTDPDPDVTSPADSSNPTTTTSPDTINNDVAPPSCGSVPLDGGEVEMSGGEGSWSSPAINVLGGSGPEILGIEFTSSATGTFDLSGQTPSNCTRCLQLTVDAGSGTAKSFFVTAGTIQITGNPLGQLNAQLSNVRMSELGSNNTVLPNGECYQVASLRLVSDEETCVPDCAGRECGSDGCGDTCGSCSGGESCNASGQCVGGTSTCPTLTVPNALEVDAEFSNGYSVTLSSPAGYLLAEMFSASTGNFSLTSGVNANYATCEQCIGLRLEDGRAFFQTAGSVNVSGFPMDGEIGLALNNVEVREVTITEGTFQSTLVSGGACYRLGNISLSAP